MSDVLSTLMLRLQGDPTDLNALSASADKLSLQLGKLDRSVGDSGLAMEKLGSHLATMLQRAEGSPAAVAVGGAVRGRGTADCANALCHRRNSLIAPRSWLVSLPQPSCAAPRYSGVSCTLAPP